MSAVFESAASQATPVVRRASAWRRVAHVAGRLAVPLIVLVLWQIFGALHKLPLYLSYPTQIAAAAREVTAQGEMWPYLRDSMIRLIGGFAIGSVIGIVLGLLAGLSRAVREFVDPLVAFLYPIPKIAFLPIMLILFGLGGATQTAIVALSVSFPVFFATQHAVTQMDKHLVWTAKNFETPFPALLFRVVLPASLPGIFSGLRVGLALAFISLFAAELIGAKTGLSLFISEGQDWLRYDIMLTGVVTYALLGFLADRLLMAVRRRVLRGSLLGTEEAQR
jgi:ABC-type nitrate/sulfonate/bicarbonate transport system permease component